MKDDQPKHRQAARAHAKLERRRASRAGLPTALIVCEGRCTEPYYLRGLRAYLGVNAANAEIDAGTDRTDAKGLISRAQQHFRMKPEYDQVFVVLDGDQPGLAEARRAATRSLRKSDGGRVSIDLIVTTPCFEFWLLLHFEYTTRVFTSGDEVTRALEAHLTDYQKGDRDIFAKVEHGLARAEADASRVNLEVADIGGTSPGTDMPKLIEVLRGMKRPAAPAP